MKLVPSYTKVLTLGASYTEEALTGHVVLQGKVDGSQFGFGLNEDGNVDDFLDSLVDIFGTEPDGHKTWVKTTDEIQEALKQPLKVFIDSQLQSVFEEIESEFEDAVIVTGWKNGDGTQTPKRVLLCDEVDEILESLRQKYLSVE